MSNTLSCASTPESDMKWEYTQYLQILIEAQKAGYNCHKEIGETIDKLHDLIFAK